MNHLDKTVDCYDQQAQHFVQTRNKYRPEVDIFLSYLPEVRPLRVLDLGCGGGRLYEPLKTELGPRQLKYTGVDNAPGMIKEAKKDRPKVNFVCQDMVTFLSEQEAGSVDLIVAMASLQHIYTSQERIRAFHHLYNVLSYGGRAIVINWSFSHRFLGKYPLEMSKGLLQSVWKKGRQWNDYMIPWKTTKGTTEYERYYHIYTLYELKELARLAGFKVDTAAYVGKDGALTMDWRETRNTFLVLEKGI